MDYRVLVINPGSTSAKIGLFAGEERLFQEAPHHSAEDLPPFTDQVVFCRAGRVLSSEKKPHTFGERL